MTGTPIDISEEDGIRYLHFGSEWVQGAMRIRRPVDLMLEYTREMLFGLLLHDNFAPEGPWPKKILLIGLGAGSLTKFCYWRLPRTRITTVEIDEGVWAVASQMFKLPDNDTRLHVEIADGVEFMTRQGSSYDYILIDGYDANARVGALDSLPFYQACRARLNDGGILATNLFGRLRRYTAPLQRLSTAFDGNICALPACDSGNVVALAGVGVSLGVPLPELSVRAKQLKAAIGLDLRPTIKRLRETAGGG